MSWVTLVGGVNFLSGWVKGRAKCWGGLNTWGSIRPSLVLPCHEGGLGAVGVMVTHFTGWTIDFGLILYELILSDLIKLPLKTTTSNPLFIYMQQSNMKNKNLVFHKLFSFVNKCGWTSSSRWVSNHSDTWGERRLCLHCDVADRDGLAASALCTSACVFQLRSPGCWPGVWEELLMFRLRHYWSDEWWQT